MAKLSDDSKQELLNVMRRFKREKFQPYIDHHDLTPSEVNVVLCIHVAQEHGRNPIHPRMVAAWMHLTPSALSQTLKVLEKKGYLVRQRTSEDSRAVAIALTEKGFAIAEEMAKARDQFLDEMVEFIGEEDIRHLIATFNKAFDFLSMQVEAGVIQRGNCGFKHPSCSPDPYSEGNQ